MLHYHYSSLEFINSKLRKFETIMKEAFESSANLDPAAQLKEQELKMFKK